GVSYTVNSERCLPGVGDVIGNLLHLQNVVVRPLCSDGPIWSIANEVFYYALFPLLFVALWGATARVRMLAVVGAALLAVYGLQEPVGRGGMLVYFAVWMMGATAAYPFAAGRRALPLIAAVAALALACAVWGRETGIHYYYGIAAMTTAGLLLARRRGAPVWLRRPRVKRVTHGLAAFSFSLYLFHMPAMNLARGAFGIPRATGEVSVATVSLFAAFFVLAYAAGAAAWWLFERHTPRLRAVVSRHAGLLPRPAVAAPAVVAQR
ncbi:MAG TPA: acyltransferase family protein, partial [Longimicrobium sp.]|nr:acyltransferase family protein [Longimicrobium sp.]